MLLISVSFSALSADTFEIRPNKIATEPSIKTTKNDKKLKTGLAVDIKAYEKSKFNYTVAYEGDYMFVNDYLEEENQIENNNFYIGIGYKF